MLIKFNSTYFITTIIVIFLGILSRKIDWIPLFIGDILYAVMIYFLIQSFLKIEKNWIKIILPLMVCYMIEISQLINLSWLNHIRKTTLGHYILGQGFLITDLICYTIGIALANYLSTSKCFPQPR